MKALIEALNLPEDNKLFIDGAWVQSNSSHRYSVIDPGTSIPFMSNANACADDIEKAVHSSTQGQQNWQKLTPSERALCLFDLARALEECLQEFATVEAIDTGKPYSEAQGDIQVCIDFLRFYAGLCDKIHGETIPIDSTQMSFTIKEPVGVTLHIIPWNFPLFTCIRGIAPALAAGCSVIIKPSEHAPASILKFAQLTAEINFPSGVINVITGLGLPTGELLCQHPVIKHITFTGSKKTGTQVLKCAANNMTTCTMELGGKSPAIVFGDADIDSAVEDVFVASFLNSGQVCSCASRIILDRSIKNVFREKLISKVANSDMGHGMTDRQFAAINNQTQLDKIETFVNQAIQEGAEILAGGKRHIDPEHPNGLYFLPTIIDNLAPDSTLLTQEIFGPVICLQTFEDEEQAVCLANNSEFGLQAGIYTRDITRALRISKKIDAGQVNINQYYTSEVYIPFGGNKSSGFGRECGAGAVENYLKTKATSINLNIE